MSQKMKKFLIWRFGQTEGTELWEKAQNIYEELIPFAGEESDGRKKNLLSSVYPFAAVYRALSAAGYSKEAALEHVTAIMERKTLSSSRKMYKRMGRLPFFFVLFKKMFSMGLRGDSWKVVWIENSRELFAYDIKECLWHDACTDLGCPELCSIFCRNDEINFGDVSRQLHFRRSTALGYGGKCCDFRFYRHKPE